MPLPRFLRRLLWLWAFFGVVLIALVVLNIVATNHAATNESAGQLITITDNGGGSVTRMVDIADNPDEWRRGLQNRPLVQRGMLFVFQDEAPRSFWMKDTLVPLDIAYFRTDGTWVSSAHMVPCSADPCATYPSGGPARYALELPVGDIGPHIGTGWVITLITSEGV